MCALRTGKAPPRPGQEGGAPPPCTPCPAAEGVTGAKVLALPILQDEPFDGDALRFRRGIEAQRLGLAYEHDPYFSLSIARVDPLQHQLEAVYECSRRRDGIG
jgi:hypothetical protein